MDTNLNPTAQISNNLVINDLYSAFLVMKTVAKYGIPNIKKAVVSGNYYKPTGNMLIMNTAWGMKVEVILFAFAGMGFGGTSLAASTRVLIELAKQMNSHELESLLLLAVHSGFGPPGNTCVCLYDLCVLFGHHHPNQGVDTLMSMGEKAVTETGESVVDAIYAVEHANLDKPDAVTGGIKDFIGGEPIIDGSVEEPVHLCCVLRLQTKTKDRTQHRPDMSLPLAQRQSFAGMNNRSNLRICLHV
jgi:hypothetical protein